MKTVLVEGVNIYDNLFDTEQLSVIRGTSFLYKDAIDYISAKYSATLEPLRTGGSSGLFLIQEGGAGGDSCSADELCKGIRAALAEHGDYSLLTFIVVDASADSLTESVNQLLTKLRFEQLSSFTVMPDRLLSEEWESELGPCELAGSRIRALDSSCERAIQSSAGALTRRLSRSVQLRYDYGRRQKQEFYKHLLSENALNSLESNYRFAESFDEIAKEPGADDEEMAAVSPRLAGKIAVFYADGNRIGKLQESIVGESVALQQKFDQDMISVRASFLGNTIESLMQEEGVTSEPRREGDKKILRLETLLWGGDEVIFVMPAWKGFDFLQRFFQWEWKVGEESFTHAAGIVFCNAKSPIRIIKQLAMGLADGIKDKEASNDTVPDGWDYLVLESIDYPTDPYIKQYFRQRYGALAAELRNSALPALAKKSWRQERRQMVQFFDEGKITRRQLHLMVATISSIDAPDVFIASLPPWLSYFEATGRPAVDAHAFEKAEYRFCQVCDDQNWLKNEWPKCCLRWFGLNLDVPGERLWVWLHLIELWDYLVPDAGQFESTIPPVKNNSEVTE